MDLNKLGTISWSLRPSEFEIQACIYGQLIEEFICVRGEVKASQMFEGRIRRCKFDLVVFDDQQRAIVIIEVKNFSKAKAELLLSKRAATKQCSKYNLFGVPVLYCGHMDFVPVIIERVRALL